MGYAGPCMVSEPSVREPHGPQGMSANKDLVLRCSPGSSDLVTAVHATSSHSLLMLQGTRLQLLLVARTPHLQLCRDICFRSREIVVPDYSTTGLYNQTSMLSHATPSSLTRNLYKHSLQALTVWQAHWSRLAQLPVTRSHSCRALQTGNCRHLAC